ncbi:MAG: hypothetical protein ACKVI8_00310 [Paraglaciecola sp.]
MLNKNGVDQYIKGNDKRLVDYCLRILSARGEMPDLSFSTAVEGAESINRFVHSRGGSSTESAQYVNDLLTEAKQTLLPLRELDWLKKSDRTCFYVWAEISNSQFFASPNAPVSHGNSPQYNAYALHYNQLGLKVWPSNTQERFDEVINFFDRVRQPLSWQLQLIVELRNWWSEIYTTRKPFSWLKQDDEAQCRWAWEYMSKITWTGNRPPVLNAKPVGLNEMYAAMYAVYDSWNASPDTKRLFLNDFNKAWQQKKHRDSRQGKKVCNIVLNSDVKDMLDELATLRGMKKNELIENLIINEHKNVN